MSANLAVLEQRLNERFVCQLRPLVSLVSDVENPCCQAVVRDISREGVGLLLQRPFEPGTVMNIQFQFGQLDHCHCWLLAEVRQATPQSDGSWLVGCRMSMAFTHEEISALAPI